MPKQFFSLLEVIGTFILASTFLSAYTTQGLIIVKAGSFETGREEAHMIPESVKLEV